MGIFYNPPPAPTIPPVPLKKLPPAIAAIRGDNPPVLCGANDPDLYFTIRQSDTPDPPPKQGFRSTIPVIYPTIADNPPVNNPISFFSRIRQWDAPDPQPRQGLKTVIPALYPFSIDTLGNPPITSWTQLLHILRKWDAPDPQPKQGFKSIIPLLYPVTVDNPPVLCGANDPDYYLSIRQSDAPAPWPKQRPVVYTEGIIVITNDNPPFTIFSRTPLFWEIMQLWNPPDPQPKMKMPIASPPGWSVDNPPIRNNTQLMNIVRLHDASTYRFILPVYLPQISIINLPPFTQLSRTALFQGIMQLWRPPEPMPPRSLINLCPAISVVRGDAAPPFRLPNLYSMLEPWQYPRYVPELYIPAIKNIFSTFAPAIMTQNASSIFATLFTANGNIINNGAPNCFRRGFCVKAGITGNATIDDMVFEKYGDFAPGVFNLIISGLIPESDYRYCAFAENDEGFTYGDTLSVITGIFINPDAICLCPTCKSIFMADSAMYEDPDVCPTCGITLSAAKKSREENKYNG